METPILQRELNQAKELTLEWREPAPLLPTLLFNGNFTLNRALALWKLTLTLKEHEVPSATDATRFSREKPDLLHVLGLHRPITMMGLQGWLGRLTQSPEVLNLDTDLANYLEWFVGNDRRYHPLALSPISRYSPWSKQAWRRRYQSTTQTPMVDAWPFIDGPPTSDHDLLVAVDKIVPKGMAEDIRADTCQDILCAIYAEEITFEEVVGAPQTLKSFIRGAYRSGPQQFQRSLDAPEFMDDLILHERKEIQNRATQPQVAYLAEERMGEIETITGGRSIEELERLDPATLMWIKEQLREAGYHGAIWHPEDVERDLRGPPPRKLTDSGARPRRSLRGRRPTQGGKPGRTLSDGTLLLHSDQQTAINQFEDDEPDLSNVVRWDDPRWEKDDADTKPQG